MRFNYPNTDYVFQPGDAIYEDINKDGNIDSRDVVYLGNSNPKFTGGFGPNFLLYIRNQAGGPQGRDFYRRAAGARKLRAARPAHK